ncbi:MAG: hypothetical protein ACHQVS_01615 [Candidatus Babeliales bacterium]
MKQLYRGMCALLCAFTIIPNFMYGDCNSCSNPKTIFIPRSQSFNAARDLVGQQMYINQPDKNETYGCLSATAEYTRSFRPDLITDYFFGQAANDGCVIFSGSLVPNRGANDFLADYFGLPQDFQSKVCFTPRIQNFLIDFNFYVGLDAAAPGAFFKAEFPLVYTRWAMNPCEKVINEGSLPYPNGYMAINQIPRSDLANGVLPFFAGKTTFGDMKTPLKYGKITCDAQTKTTIGDIQMWLGYNFINTQAAHVGFSLLAIFPAGNKPDPEYLFTPIVGSGGFYQAGIGFTSHFKLWDGDNNRSLILYADVNIMHAFKTSQVRPFDFQDNGPASRYMLLATFDETMTNADLTPAIGQVNAKYDYTGSLIPAVNLTSLCCAVSYKLQGDAVVKLGYLHDDWEFDFGYNFWGRSAEQVSVTQKLIEDRVGLKGDAFLYGAAGPTYAIAQATYPASAVSIPATESDLATINSGSNFNTALSLGGSPYLNAGIDDIQDAQATTTYVTQPVDVFSAVSGTPQVAMQMSNPPTLFNSFDDTYTDSASKAYVDGVSAAAPSVVTHKFFAHASYNFEELRGHVHPFLGIGGEVEFDTKHKSGSNGGHCDCRGALNQWGIWIKGGIGF